VNAKLKLAKDENTKNIQKVKDLKTKRREAGKDVQMSALLNQIKQEK